MRVTERAGHSLALEIHDSLEAGFLSLSTLERAAEYGMASQVGSLERSCLPDTHRATAIREMQLHRISYALGRTDGANAMEQVAASPIHPEVWLSGIVKEHRDALSGWIKQNHSRVANLVLAGQVGLLDPEDLGDERHAVLADLLETGRLLISERYFEGFVDGVGLRWLELAAASLVEGLRKEAEAQLRQSADHLEDWIQRMDAVLWTAQPLTDRQTVLLYAERAIWNDCADRYALRMLADLFVGSHQDGVDPWDTVTEIRGVLAPECAATGKAEADAGATKERILGLPTGDDDLSMMVRAYEVNRLVRTEGIKD